MKQEAKERLSKSRSRSKSSKKGKDMKNWWPALCFDSHKNTHWYLDKEIEEYWGIVEVWLTKGEKKANNFQIKGSKIVSTIDFFFSFNLLMKLGSIKECYQDYLL